jgi:NAD(P)-dependent dehydrogenase (short-subunit alcohol dehydrogenase family)
MTQTRVLDGGVAIVTGASRGIGAAIARRLAEAGAAVAVSARTEDSTDQRLPGTIHETVEAIKAGGGRAVAIRADLTSDADRRRLVEQAEAEQGPVDILVNDAAVTWFQPIDGFPGRRFEVMFEVQVRAPFELAQLVLPGMRQRGRGWILNISSGAARHPQGPPYDARARRGGTVYGMCKAAIERLSTGLAAEVYDDGIAVNALSPSKVVATPGVLVHHLIPEGQEDQAEPVEMMAEAALVLCSGDPKTLTGLIAYSQTLLETQGITIR